MIASRSSYELTALSGLAAATKNLAVISNNIANTQTTAFKSSRTEFVDLYTGGFNAAGSGVRVAAVSQDFSQGVITGSNNDLDMAISGKGMFVVEDSTGNEIYTRNGTMSVDKDGYVVTNTGLNLLGFPLNAAQSTALNPVFQNTLSPILLDGQNNTPKATTEQFVDINLDASVNFNSDLSGNLLVDAAGGTILIADAVATTQDIQALLRTGAYTGTADFSTTQEAFDSLGTAHRVQYDFYKLGVDGTNPNAQESVWHLSMTLQDYDEVNRTWVTSSVVNPGVNDNPRTLDFQVRFDNLGMVTQLIGDPDGDGLADYSGGVLPNLAFDINRPISGAVNPLNNLLGIQSDFSALTQFAGAHNIRGLDQNGYPVGDLIGVNVDQDGVIYATYSNGETSAIAQVALANFRNLNGLSQLSDGYYAATAAAGVRQLSSPGEAGLGALVASSLESSNADITAELVNIISAQRHYQANAQVLSTSRELTQTILNI
jgi:flagellar hook protein FlgE